MSGAARRAAFALACALAVAWLAASPRADAAAQGAALADGARDAASVLQAMYGSINDGDAESYLAEALLDPTVAVGSSRRCVRTDNAIGSMPSPLAAPQFPPASIAQRGDLVGALAAYIQAVAGLAATAPANETAANLAALRRAVGRLNASAASHLERDLAIAVPSATLARAADSLETEMPRGAALERIVGATNPTVAKLIDILDADVQAGRAATTAAADAEYATWSDYYERIRRLALAGAPRNRRIVPPLPRCAAPYPFRGQAAGPPAAGEDRFGTVSATPPAVDPQADAATFGVRATAVGVWSAARERAVILRSADPSSLTASLRKANAALLRFVAAPQDAGSAADFVSASGEFADAARIAAGAYRALK